MSPAATGGTGAKAKEPAAKPKAGPGSEPTPAYSPSPWRRLTRPLLTIWRRLTSMRTALILLFLLAVAAVPGSLLPQRPLNAAKTASYIASHGAWGQFLERIGMFDVFGSVWFAAIYLLLFVSLIGCLIPRIRVHARASVRKPLPAPKNLSRLPESGAFATVDSAPDYAAAARGVLGRRWRIVERDEPDGVLTLSAEKGYSRETGNLLFHIALVVALVLIAIGRLYTYEGQRIVISGPDGGFCNTVSQYDDWRPGRLAAEGKVHPGPFCIWSVDQFTAKYDSEGEPSEYAAAITYSDTATSPRKHTTIKVNHPLRLEGDRVYLITHGFAPQLTIHMPSGQTVTDTQAFIASDPTTLFSNGAFKEQGVPGKNQDIGISGYFVPSPTFAPDGTIESASPQVNHPLLGITVYQGNTQVSDGLPQSVYSLNTAQMHQLGSAKLYAGETAKLPGGVTVRFDGWTPWVQLQVSHDPSQGYLLIAAAAMVLGLLGSLGVRRRRVWLRITPAEEGAEASPTVVAVGGLARTDTGNFAGEFAGLFERLREAASPAPDAVGALGAVGAGKE